MKNFFDLAKYAHTGIASPGMTAFDKMRALAAFGGSVQTLTGQPPLTFKADGTPLISWSMLGNGSQQGTPTPDNPVMPEFVGVKTGNLFDKSSATIYKAYINSQGYWLPSDDSSSVKIPCLPNTKYTLSIPLSVAIFRVYETSDSSALPSDQAVLNGLVREQDKSQSRFTTGANAAAIIFQGSASSVDTWFNGLMFSLGSTALPYEPYGWAEKITCAGQTVPVYLGQTQTVRRVKKLVLTGGDDENWSVVTISANNCIFRLDLSEYPLSGVAPISTHYTGSTADLWVDVADGEVTTSIRNLNAVAIHHIGLSGVTDWKAYLAQQYTAGHPVTVWYVLATSETAIVNEPLAKISDYADELHSEDAGVSIPTAKGNNVLTIDTPIQPSEMSITYRG